MYTKNVKVLLRGDTDGFIRTAGPEIDTEAEEEPEAREEPEIPVTCAACGNLVTHRKCRSTISGSFEHVFTNPHGYVFRIGLFTSAEGVVPAGMWIEEFSWFADTAWRFVVCSSCFAHLGWEYRYLSKEGNFYGLILTKLKGVE